MLFLHPMIVLRIAFSRSLEVFSRGSGSGSGWHLTAVCGLQSTGSFLKNWCTSVLCFPSFLSCSSVVPWYSKHLSDTSSDWSLAASTSSILCNNLRGDSVNFFRHLNHTWVSSVALLPGSRWVYELSAVDHLFSITSFTDPFHDYKRSNPPLQMFCNQIYSSNKFCKWSFRPNKGKSRQNFISCYAMIKGILIINNLGKPRLVKFYQSVVSLLFFDLLPIRYMTYISASLRRQAKTNSKALYAESSNKLHSVRTLSVITWRVAFRNGVIQRRSFTDIMQLFTSYSL